MTSIVDLRSAIHRSSKVATSIFDLHARVAVTVYSPTFEDRCVNFRISMCRPSKIDVLPFEDRFHDVSTFGDGCVDLRREDR